MVIMPMALLGVSMHFKVQSVFIKLCHTLLIFIMFSFILSCKSFYYEHFGGVTIKKHEPFIVKQSKGSLNWGYLSHPFVSSYSNTLYLTYNLSGDGQGSLPKELSREDGPAYSSDRGKTWIYGNAAKEAHEQMPSRGVRLSSGEFIWPPVKKASFNPMGVELANGDILFVSHTRETTNSPLSTILTSSEDGGQTYSQRSVVATKKDASWGNEGPCEPSMALLKNGELLVVMRTGSRGFASFSGTTKAGQFLFARSSDGGYTWKTKWSSIPGVMPKLLQMSNGILVLAFGRPGNNLIFSSDNGHSWWGEIGLTPPDVKTSGYCAIAEVASNRLFVAYDVFNTDTSGIWLWEPKKRNKIMGLFIDIIHE